MAATPNRKGMCPAFTVIRNDGSRDDGGREAKFFGHQTRKQVEAKAKRVSVKHAASDTITMPRGADTVMNFDPYVA